ncbi:MAG TPA: hypothetical protein VEJ63_10175 [Planctomycetota bacterium]|nr:hypothetical protein [Planctomycetota bacterium]
MKRAILFAVPFALALMLATSIRAEDKPAAKEGEWTATVGCGHCNFEKDTKAKECCAAAKVGDKVFTLKGDKVTKEFKKGGEYVIKGKISDDGKTIEVTEMKKKEG